MNKKHRQIKCQFCIFILIIASFAFGKPAAAANRPDNPLQDLSSRLATFAEKVFGTHEAPPGDELQPSVIRPRHGTPLNPTKFYLVEMKCSARVKSSELMSQGLAVKENTFVAHTLWISNSKASPDGSVPTNPAKLVNVFSFEKTASGVITDFHNGACSQKFLLSGKDSILTVSFSVTDMKTLSGPAQILYGAAKAVAGVAPIFTTGSLATVLAGAVKGVGSTEDPLKQIITAINNSPRKASVAVRLLWSSKPTIVSTKYSEVSIMVKPVNDMAELISNSDELRQNFLDTVDAISKDYLKGISDASLKNKCASFAHTLWRDYTFDRKDMSFIIGYFAQAAFPSDVDKRLSCIGNRFNATDIVAYKFIYNVNVAGLHKITQQDINNHPWIDKFSTVPLSRDRAWAFAEHFSSLLSIYAQTAPANNSKVKAALLRLIGSNMIVVDDLTSKIRLSRGSMSPIAFVSKLEILGFKRFGCFWLKPTVGAGAFDAIVLAMPLKPGKNGAYDVSVVDGIRLALSGTGKPQEPAFLRGVQVTDFPPAILEAAKASNGICGEGAKINLLKAVASSKGLSSGEKS